MISVELTDTQSKWLCIYNFCHFSNFFVRNWVRAGGFWAWSPLLRNNVIF